MPLVTSYMKEDKTVTGDLYQTQTGTYYLEVRSQDGTLLNKKDYSSNDLVEIQKEAFELVKNIGQLNG